MFAGFCSLYLLPSVTAPGCKLALCAELVTINIVAAVTNKKDINHFHVFSSTGGNETEEKQNNKEPKAQSQEAGLFQAP